MIPSENGDKARWLKRGLVGIMAMTLAGCAAQPITRPVQPVYRADTAQAQTDLYFQPGSGKLASGELERLRQFLAGLALHPNDDILVDVPSTGSPVLDGQRLAVARQAFAHVPARIKFAGPRGFGTTEGRPDAGFVQVIRYDRIRVDCENFGRSAFETEYLVEFLPIGCANALNRAEMAANKRDLVAPRALAPADAARAGKAVEQLRSGKTQPLKSQNKG